jgi:hypothetical protein
MKQIRSLFYFLVLIVVGGAFAWGARTFYAASDVAIPAAERAIMLTFPALVVVAFLVGWTERFLLRNGALIGVIGSIILILHEKSPIGKSLTNLRLWYAFAKRREDHPEEMTVDGAGEVPPGFLEYTKGLTLQEKSDFLAKNSFSQWMVADVVKRYENNVNGFAYLGAGILIFLIGLRGLGIIGREHPLPIVLSLEIEFTIIGALGLLLFYKPEESTKMSVKLEGSLPEAEQQMAMLATEIKKIREEVTGDRTITLQVSRKKN